MTQRKLAVFDIDGTLFRSGLYREVFYELSKMGAVPAEMSEAATLKHREWNHRINGNAFEEFERFLVNNLDDYLTKLRTADYDTAVARVVESKADNVYVYTRNLLRQLQQEGYITIAISGSQQELVEPFAKHYNFDAWVGQYWERAGEYFSGKVIKTHTNKDKIIHDLVSQYDLTLADSYGVGDSNGDVGMLQLVDNPIAFNPTQELFDKAVEHGWKIVIERKNTSYELTQGAPDEPYVLAKANHH